MKTYHIESRKNGVVEKVMYDKEKGLHEFKDAGYCKKFHTEELVKEEGVDYRCVETTTIVRKSKWNGRMRLNKVIFSRHGEEEEISKDLETFILSTVEECEDLEKQNDKLMISLGVYDSDEPFDIKCILATSYGLTEIYGEVGDYILQLKNENKKLQLKNNELNIKNLDLIFKYNRKYFVKLLDDTLNRIKSTLN